MSKLVDLKRLQQLAEALDSRMKAKVSAEESRAKGVEEGLDTAIKAIQADYLKEADKYDDSELQGKVGTLESKVAALEAGTYDDTEVRGLVAAAQAQADKGVADAAAAQSAADAVQAEMNAFKAAAEVGDAAIDTLKEIQSYIESDLAAADEMVKDIAAAAQAAADEKSRAEEAEGVLAGRLDVLEAIDHDAYADADAALKAELEGQIKVKADQSALKDVDDRVKDLEDAKDDYKAYADQAEADAITAAQSYVDGKDSAMDTRVKALESFKDSHKHSDMEKAIEQLETAIGTEELRAQTEEGKLSDRLDAVEDFVEGYEAFDPSELEAAIALKADASVVEALSGEVAEKAAKSYVDAELAKKAVASEVTAALALKADASVVSSLADEVSLKAAKSYVDEELVKKVAKEEGKSLIADSEIARLATLENYDDSSVKQRLESLEAIKHEEFAKSADVNASLAEKAAQSDLVALQGVVANKVEQDDIDSAIAQEVADRNSAIGKVVQSLDVAVTEEGKIVLSLGGQESGFEICSKELPFATEAEIAQIIAGLDATPEA